MSYQVLARRWRPQTFAQMVGQEHVLRALVNASNAIACTMLSSHRHPRCRQDHARAPDRQVPQLRAGRFGHALRRVHGLPRDRRGRFVDLLEVDAASRTKVEDTRTSSRTCSTLRAGRFKVYLIDEVHMLSTHSFNALLKTLEEPPPHVKFLLATTDPQKLPATVLSRCLQFHLKNLAPEQISAHLAHVLRAETSRSRTLRCGSSP